MSEVSAVSGANWKKGKNGLLPEGRRVRIPEKFEAEVHFEPFGSVIVPAVFND